MGTKLTYQGVDGAVELDDQAITVRGGGVTATPSAADGSTAEGGDGESVVIPRWEVEDVTVKPASLLGYGTLEITTRAGRRHTVQFGRDAQERFENLAAIIG